MYIAADLSPRTPPLVEYTKMQTPRSPRTPPLVEAQRRAAEALGGLVVEEEDGVVVGRDTLAAAAPAPVGRAGLFSSSSGATVCGHTW